ncbi:ABC transporter ATP-binding protein [Amycolatopsis albispora]|uniref:ABC transporter ATP-binding protein n=1 Tax=Amycolatopsis albispora TaxID=1804986 RepID=A0A344L3W5_9PSEU|nr:ABC transporter ATP-binding protein [Amycolatopsis albispora]AXB42739.1 ABC transporter ATP-binding protein [Amycolatopsis albispora]
MTDPLLQVDELRVALRTRAGARPILRGVSFGIRAGEAFGLVGESGSGKSMTARSIIRLLPENAETGGIVTFDGVPVTGLGPAGLRKLRSTGLAMIFQDPRAHINPIRTVGDFLCEGLVLTRGATRRDARRVARRLLTDVRIPDAERRLRQYPYELSGGLLQRVMIAAALAIEPKLILADEPTTALDVTTQEEVMAILDEQRRQRDLALLFITHDLDLAAAVCDRTAVMYAGRIVETAPTGALHRDATHPYTRALLAARPAIARPGERLATVPGRPAAAWEAEAGCAFQPRCPRATDRCAREDPADRPVHDSVVACHHAGEHTEVPV